MFGLTPFEIPKDGEAVFPGATGPFPGNPENNCTDPIRADFFARIQTLTFLDASAIAPAVKQHRRTHGASLPI